MLRDMRYVHLRPSTIGIIGGGQLARMLAMAAARLGLRTIVLEPDQNCPAAQVTNDHLIYDYDNETGLAVLAEASDVITYEFENVPVAAAQFLEGRIAHDRAPYDRPVAGSRRTAARLLDADLVCAAQSPVSSAAGVGGHAAAA